MKKIKIYTGAITLVIAGLLITSTVFASLPNTQKNTSSSEKTAKNPSGIRMMPITPCCPVRAGNLPKYKMTSASFRSTPMANSLGFGEDVLIHTNGTGDCQNPAIVTDGGTNILIWAETPSPTSNEYNALFGRWSTDLGVTWSESTGGWDLANRTHPDIGFYPKLDYYGLDAWNHKRPMTYGTWTNTYWEGNVHYTVLPDITDPDYDPDGDGWGWTPWYAKWGDKGITYDSADAASYSNQSDIPNEWFYGLTAMTGTVTDQGDPASNENDTMMLSFFASATEVSLVWFVNVPEVCTNITTDIDQSSGRLLIASEYKDHPSTEPPIPPGTEILYADITNDPNWPANADFKGWYLFGLHHPDVISDNNGNVYVVGDGDYDEDGNKDIICFYSTDNGENFEDPVIVANTTGHDNEYPCITTTGEGKLFCSYTREGDLYFAISEDGGATWEEHPGGEINDESGHVVQGYSSHSIDDIFPTWTDNRNGKNEVYFDFLETRPVLRIEEIQIGLGKVSAVIKNVGSEDADDVEWSIKFGGGGIVNPLRGSDYSGTIESLQIGDNETVETGLILGFGEATIIVTATAPGANEAKKPMDVFILFCFILIPEEE